MIPSGSFQTVVGALRQALRPVAGDEAPLEAQLLLQHATGLSRSALLAHADDTIARGALEQLNRNLSRRLAAEPLAYILGGRDFYGLAFEVNPHVLIPRPETELLVQRIIGLAGTTFAARPLLIADLGAGSGCISVAAAVAVPRLHAYAVDRSRRALETTARNAQRHRVLPRIALVEGDMADPLPAAVDILVSNPPYVPSAEAATLASGAVHEPLDALNGGADGLDFYRRLIPGVGDRLRRPGVALFEIGATQGPAVLELATRANPSAVHLHRDLANLNRVLELTFE